MKEIAEISVKERFGILDKTLSYVPKNNIYEIKPIRKISLTIKQTKQ